MLNCAFMYFGKYCTHRIRTSLLVFSSGHISIVQFHQLIRKSQGKSDQYTDWTSNFYNFPKRRKKRQLEVNLKSAITTYAYQTNRNRVSGSCVMRYQFKQWKYWRSMHILANFKTNGKKGIHQIKLHSFTGFVLKWNTFCVLFCLFTKKITLVRSVASAFCFAAFCWIEYNTVVVCKEEEELKGTERKSENKNRSIS